VRGGKWLHVDLFSGIGGFALAGAWTQRVETIGFCEVDPWCRRVLAKHWPGVPQHDDIHTLTGDVVSGWAMGRTVSLITGGFPCQGFSLAGKRLGEKDDRYLWPEMHRVVAEVRPTYVMAENVPGIISMAHGLDRVLTDLDSLGYAAGTVVIPAAAVGAYHRRDRVWIIGRDVGDPPRRGLRRGEAPGQGGLAALAGEDAAHPDQQSEPVGSVDGRAGANHTTTGMKLSAAWVARLMMYPDGWLDDLPSDPIGKPASPASRNTKPTG
jgi:DNA-cytosine methyltransferase